MSAKVESARQAAANVNFSSWYQYLLLGVLGVLTLRNVLLHVLEHRRVRQIEVDAVRLPSFNDEKAGTRTPSTVGSASYKAPLIDRLDSCAFHPLLVGLSGVKLFLIASVVGVNLAFLLVVAVNVKPPKSTYLNVPHAVALRAGYMAMAQAPAVFALTGRNGIVAFLTGIDYKDLRFAHRIFASAWILLAVVHWLGMTLATLSWAGTAGVTKLYNNAIIPFGILILIGLISNALFSQPWFRRNQYQAWLILHQIASILILVGVYYHAPPVRYFTYTAIALWAFERLTRLLQFFSLNNLVRLKARKPLVKARATLVHGAIVLKVPMPHGNWTAEQHAYLGFPGFLNICWQSHPFSIANVPSSSSGPHEMLFVVRVQGGATAALAQRLSTKPNSTEELVVAVEGPYGRGRSDVGAFKEVLLVAGGSGITHVMSVLSEAIQQVRLRKSVTQKIHLHWILQHPEQSSWLLSSLSSSLSLASTLGLPLFLTFHTTRGPLPSPTFLSRSSSHTAINEIEEASKDEARQGGRKGSVVPVEGPMGGIEELRRVEGAAEGAVRHETGRMDVEKEVRRVVEGARGATLVVACGPSLLIDSVRQSVASLKTLHPVTLDIASYSY